ncbi:hypothetical protein Tel_13010 [Candidatus Tenderia electrophaga]|jgi:ribosomal protein S3AE|uniref:Uncharacterized protein n=1 Tax=Candidatus Tenderia electrophaga TaxID=1748243 RepID=A0A0S2TFP9_9GAMM|nr:hypothetical protein Tel_13010 [Candidatus Tenderia electrophaga]
MANTDSTALPPSPTQFDGDYRIREIADQTGDASSDIRAVVEMINDVIEAQNTNWQSHVLMLTRLLGSIANNIDEASNVAYSILHSNESH